ncbi:hypothetical protein KAI92_02540 [Candidatus Parcubacteria bacterium]|nr:hypothetical protein [Candidatus Parcubacteria bacterium]
MKKYISIGIIVIIILVSAYFIFQQEEIDNNNTADNRICITESGKAYYPPNEKCCGELKSIFGPDVSAIECKLIKKQGTGAPICAPCGNNVCETQYGENKCSCPEDCK